MDKIHIETITTQQFRSKSTNQSYTSKEEFLKHHAEEDLAVDTTVQVTPKGLELMQKVMNQK